MKKNKIKNTHTGINHNPKKKLTNHRNSNYIKKTLKFKTPQEKTH
jgi:hypothetical protein